MKEAEETVDAYLDHLRLERRLSPRTVLSYRSDLTQHLAFLSSRGCSSWSRVDTDLLRADIARLHADGRARRSQARYRSSLRGFYRHLVREGWIEKDPSLDLEGPKTPRNLPQCLSHEEVGALMEACGGIEPLDLRDRAMMEVAYGAGLRVSELVGLGSEECDLENRWVRVVGKGNRERVVPLGAPACRAVRIYLERARPALVRSRHCPRLFVNRWGRALSRMGFFRILRRRAAAAALDPRRLHPHLLRHTFATHMLEAGASLRIVQELLGHSSLATTEIYTAVDRSFLRRVHRRFHPRGGGSHQEA